LTKKREEKREGIRANGKMKKKPGYLEKTRKKRGKGVSHQLPSRVEKNNANAQTPVGRERKGVTSSSREKGEKERQIPTTGIRKRRE